MAVGVTVMMENGCPPGYHVYEFAPEADKVTALPLQIVVDGLDWNDGEYTFTLTVLEFPHPLAKVPATVYVVGDCGFTMVTEPFPPEFQV
jgi:hypothetical protein